MNCLYKLAANRVLPVVFFLALPVGSADAATNTICVSTATELRTALVAADVDGGDTFIKLSVGTHQIDSLLKIGPFNTLSIAIDGGYFTQPGTTEPCNAQHLDSSSTILDGGGVSPILEITDLNVSAAQARPTSKACSGW